MLHLVRRLVKLTVLLGLASAAATALAKVRLSSTPAPSADAWPDVPRRPEA